MATTQTDLLPILSRHVGPASITTPAAAAATSSTTLAFDLTAHPSFGQLSSCAHDAVLDLERAGCTTAPTFDYRAHSTYASSRARASCFPSSRRPHCSQEPPLPPLPPPVFGSLSSLLSCTDGSAWQQQQQSAWEYDSASLESLASQAGQIFADYCSQAVLGAVAQAMREAQQIVLAVPTATATATTTATTTTAGAAAMEGDAATMTASPATGLVVGLSSPTSPTDVGRTGGTTASVTMSMAATSSESPSMSASSSSLSSSSSSSSSSSGSQSSLSGGELGGIIIAVATFFVTLPGIWYAHKQYKASKRKATEDADGVADAEKQEQSRSSSESGHVCRRCKSQES